MTKEEFIKQRIELDKVTRKYFDKNYIVIECTCNKSYCNGWRCLTESDINDVDLFNYIKKITNEKQKLIKFLKDKIRYYKAITANDTEETVESTILDTYIEILDFIEGRNEKNND